MKKIILIIIILLLLIFVLYWFFGGSTIKKYNNRKYLECGNSCNQIDSVMNRHNCRDDCLKKYYEKYYSCKVNCVKNYPREDNAQAKIECHQECINEYDYPAIKLHIPKEDILW